MRHHNKSLAVRLVPLALTALVQLPAWTAAARAESTAAPDNKLPRICALIEQEADRNGLPRDFFARLIWKESRFDHLALSPVGAQGIAQFMPGTARMRGLADPYDIEQALPASAAFLAELRRAYGNLGLAAAAYNAGETRVERWLGGGYLPIETEAYVLDITGEPVETFTDRNREIKPNPLDDTLGFQEACLKLPVIMTRAPSMAEIMFKPWFIQVAGNFRRSAAVAAWSRIKPRVTALIGDLPVVVSRVRTPLGRSGMYAVRIGADSRADANRICDGIRAKGGACVVKKTK